MLSLEEKIEKRILEQLMFEKCVTLKDLDLHRLNELTAKELGIEIEGISTEVEE